MLLCLLCLVICATVSEAFLDENRWTSYKGIINDDENLNFFTQDHINFTVNLREFANNYRHMPDAAMTLSEARMRLRLLRIYKYFHGFHSNDRVKGQSLPLAEGAKFCTKGVQMRVGCNDCTCVAGQMYMCTGMICPSNNQKPMKVCEEGTTRLVDACNRCYCHKGREYCENNICENVDRNSLRVIDHTTCDTIEVKYLSCQHCVCRNHKWVCTGVWCPQHQHPDNNIVTHFTEEHLSLLRNCTKKKTVYFGECTECTCFPNGKWTCFQSCEIETTSATPYTTPSTKRSTKRTTPPTSTRSTTSTTKLTTTITTTRSTTTTTTRSTTTTTKKTTTPTTSTTPKPRIRIPPYYDEDGNAIYLPAKDPKMHKPCVRGRILILDSCNKCYCIFEHWYCQDDIHCVPDRNETPYDEQCPLGKKIRFGVCGNCYCNQQGRYYNCKNQLPCSRVTACPENSITDPYICQGIKMRKPCRIGHKFKVGECNFCYCYFDRKYVCSSHQCKLRRRSGRCVEGHKYYLPDNCNFCLCQGGQEFCTLRACLLSAGGDFVDTGEFESFTYLKTKKEKKCLEGKTYTNEHDDLQCPSICICNYGELLCINRECAWGRAKEQFQEGSTSPHVEVASPDQQLGTCVNYEEMPSDDTCNTCICLHGQRVCTVTHCPESTPGGTSRLAAVHNLAYRPGKGSWKSSKGVSHKENDFCKPFTFYSPDNNRFCRNCFCLHNGLALCLLNLCKYEKKRDCDAQDEFHVGFFPYCAECKCSMKEWYCSVKAETCQGNATCPKGTFIHNPNQPCSICLCGGNDPGSHNMCFTDTNCVKQVISHFND